MDHNISLITTLASGFTLALIFGFVAEKIRLPALVGYLFAGVMIGPATPGFVADTHIAAQLSEIGVMLLMFGVGLHFSIHHLLSVKRIAIPGAIVQMGLATALGAGLGLWWGWSVATSVFFGICLSCASTVVLIKALESRGIIDSVNGRIAVGWLVVEDMATILILVLLPPLAGILKGTETLADNSAAVWHTLSMTLLSVVGFIALMLIVTRRLLPWLLGHVARTGSRELFTLAIVTAAIGIAYGAAELFSVSFALGAFFAGMVLSESEFSHRAAQDSLPLRDAFAVLFFVSVGMLFDPAILIQSPLHVLAVVAVIVFGKSIAAMALVLAFRYPLTTALTVSASLAQIGEFSFILAGMGVAVGLLPQEGMSLIVAGALISIALNSLLFACVTPFKNWALTKSKLARRLDRRMDTLSELPKATQPKYLQGQVIIVGYGSVGRKVSDKLAARDIPFIIVDENRERIEALRKQGITAVSGNASDPLVLAQAHIGDAKIIVIATPDAVDVHRIAENAKTMNPDIQIILRTHNDHDADHLRQAEFGAVFSANEQLGKNIAAYILERFDVDQKNRPASPKDTAH